MTKSLLELMRQTAATQTKARPPFDERPIYVCTTIRAGAACATIFWHGRPDRCPCCGTTYRPTEGPDPAERPAS